MTGTSSCPRIRSRPAANSKRRAIGAINVFDKMLRMLHPFMPFVSEEIWQVIRPYLDEPNLAAHLPIAKYPEPSATNPLSGEERAAMNRCIEATEAINSLRSLLGWHPGQRVRAFAKRMSVASFSEFDRWLPYAKTLAKTRGRDSRVE